MCARVRACMCVLHLRNKSTWKGSTRAPAHFSFLTEQSVLLHQQEKWNQSGSYLKLHVNKPQDRLVSKAFLPLWVWWWIIYILDQVWPPFFFFMDLCISWWNPQVIRAIPRETTLLGVFVNTGSGKPVQVHNTNVALSPGISCSKALTYYHRLH